MMNPLGQLFGVRCGYVQVLGSNLVGQSTGLLGIAGQNHRAKLLQARPGKFAAIQATQLLRQLGNRRV